MQFMPVIISLALAALTILVGDTLWGTRVTGNAKISVANYLRELEGRRTEQPQIKVIVGYLRRLLRNPAFRLRAGRKRRMELLNWQLKDALYSLAASLKAGCSLPTALERSLTDLKRLLANERETPILDEMTALVQSLHLGDSVENTLLEFSDRVQLEDVHDLVNGILITRSKGGNLAEIMEAIAQTITEKIEVKQEIRVLTAGKIMEARCLGTLPLIMLLILSLTSPEYMAPLYETLAGRAMLVTGLLLMLAGFVVAQKITQIDV